MLNKEVFCDKKNFKNCCNCSELLKLKKKKKKWLLSTIKNLRLNDCFATHSLSSVVNRSKLSKIINQIPLHSEEGHSSIHQIIRNIFKLSFVFNMPQTLLILKV